MEGRHRVLRRRPHTMKGTFMMPLHSTTIRICSVPECDQTHYAKSYCHPHYDRWLTTGTTDTPPRSLPPNERFWAKVSFDGPMWQGSQCWLWTGMTRSGYGRIWRGPRRFQGAHRVAYELLRGTIPHGLEIDHLCRKPLCVNPVHLEAVSHRENLLRGNGQPARNARKTHCKRGHLFDAANTYVFPKGGRMCRQCRQDKKDFTGEIT